MAVSDNWQASPLEQRIAWAVAASCIILVVIASSRPAWFDVSTYSAHHASATAAHPSEPANRAVGAPPTHQQAQTHHHATPSHRLDHARHSAPTHHRNPTKLAHGFYIQLGAFNERLRAQGLADQLKHRGWHHTVIASTKGGLHAVWIGPKSTRSAAVTLLKTVQRTFKNKGFIVHH